jgi:cyanate permease
MDTSASLSAGFTRTPVRGWVVALLSRAHLSSSAVISYAFGIYLPFIRKDLQLSPWEVGLLQGVWWVTSALVALPASVIFSRFRPGPLILVSLLIAVPFLFLQGIATSFMVLLLARFLFMCGIVLATPARPLVLQQWIAPHQYASVQAAGLCVHSSILALSLGTSAWVITLIGSWRLAYMAQGWLFVAQALLWLLIAQERYAPVQGLKRALAQPQDSPLRALRTYPRGWLLGITLFAMSATWTAIVTFLPTVLLEQHGLPPTRSGPLLGFLYYGLIPCSLLGGWIAKRVTNRKLLLWIPALCNVILGVTVVYTATPWLLMLLLTGIGLAWVVSPIIEVLPFEFPGIRPREVAVLGSLIRTLMGLGFAVGPMVTGLVAELTGSLQTGLLTLCVLTGIGVLAGLLYPHSKEIAHHATV